MALLAAFLWMSGASAAAQPAGRAVFDAAGCAACHRVDERGGNTGPDLSFVGFRRGRPWLELWLKDPKAWKPDTLMPRPGLSDADRGAVVDYLASLQGPPPGRRPWDATDPPRRGEVLFRRAGCVACHGPGGKGGHPNNNVRGGVVPAVDRVAETFTLEELVKKIAGGAHPQKSDPAGADPLAAMPAWGETLDDAELRAVAAYLMTLGGGKAKADVW